MPSPRTSPSVAAAATPSEMSSGQNAPGTSCARLRAVKAPKTTITAISAITSTAEFSSKITVIT